MKLKQLLLYAVLPAILLAFLIVIVRFFYAYDPRNPADFDLLFSSNLYILANWVAYGITFILGFLVYRKFESFKIALANGFILGLIFGVITQIFEFVVINPRMGATQLVPLVDFVSNEVNAVLVVVLIFAVLSLIGAVVAKVVKKKQAVPAVAVTEQK